MTLRLDTSIKHYTYKDINVYKYYYDRYIKVGWNNALNNEWCVAPMEEDADEYALANTRKLKSLVAQYKKNLKTHGLIHKYFYEPNIHSIGWGKNRNWNTIAIFAFLFLIMLLPLLCTIK